MEITQRLSPIDLAHVLFASPLQEQDHPTPALVHRTVVQVLGGCGGDCSACSAVVAQEAGDHPETYVRRMRWALAMVHDMYEPALPLAS